MKEVYIVSAVRTPIGSFGGIFSGISATQLGTIAIKAALAKVGLAPKEVQEVFMGNVVSANLGQAPARQAAVFAGLPHEVVCTTVNKVCASGTKAIMFGAQSIMLGINDVVVAGGMESMSNIPYYIEKARFGYKYGDGKLIDGLQKDGLWEVYHNYAMGNAADNTAKELHIAREAQDAYAIESYKRAAQATTTGLFKDEIVPVEVQRGKEVIQVLEDEEYKNVNFDKIPTLKPVFSKEGTVTAANASTINDGAAAVLLMSKEKAHALGIKPLAKIRGFADAEQSPEWFTTTPALAIPKAIKQAGISAKDVDFYEINEAFSVVALANMEKLNLNPAQVNINGGAVALGHPLGCSGARIVTTLAHILQHKDAQFGVAGICNGGGGASAMVLERV
ncbi:acetyl-CoA C-acyltransferase [Rhodocytophaga rosea]|uniref:acetyl-CoA C-acetyltransferase n=1 Tax=Rhodocytophaga rosea TaxID=2704465 RepID=A0A6C0GQA8_9BACT|nr:acetyl-CoA C-acyltransferase [Rhodocytophaga rosea]QHT69762.1 acetyl-CoA C-acyltransferase [Rhodocytophaga rosea]